MENDHETRLVNLEAIISFQDQSIDDLNGVILSQQKQLEQLRQDLNSFKQTMVSSQEEPNNKPPPHY
jgi:SlyX protein